MPSLIPKRIQNAHPLLFTPDQHTDRHKCTRQVPMRVLAMGYSRTGTASMSKALEMLDMPCYHFYRILTSIRDADMWLEAVQYKTSNNRAKLDRKFWDGLLGHVSAVADKPCLDFAEELITTYPEAKVILWERDEDEWFRSMDETLIKNYGKPQSKVFAAIDYDWLGRISAMTHAITRLCYGSNDREQIRANARLVYRQHFKTVRRLLKDQPDRLLEYKMGDGWEPICQFLELPVPAKPFPHVNESEYMESQRVALLLKILDRVFWKVVAVVSPVLVLLVAYRMSRNDRISFKQLLAAVFNQAMRIRTTSVQSKVE
ncbi:hypothetical protein M409DRAFT_51405 [Zasmidium cellare ATCC 36951]|uniref:NAD dependent epimerase/dehydratase n=1 Tax=Zasmidium cellare ATCC 36951 TaxID=1080233 RepID=A0A6A6CWY7_ZASCE|nr:uncharacterized protein M409DRAFT_51405 [Zasmidium cellare ATCC 36951]KAF2170352.1 hypothetical protein M409DRAFT_51405 [Zasmidium cellare ATCC 36951]